MGANYDIAASPPNKRLQTTAMTERKKGQKPTPKGTRMHRIVVKYHASELSEVLAGFEDQQDHPATWMRNKSLEFARKRMKP
jgi:hypothetical protein